MNLKEMKIGQSAVIEAVGGEGQLRQHFLDMGVIPGTEITLVKLAPMGDPMQFTLHGYELTLRMDDAKKIIVKPISEKHHRSVKKSKAEAHPGLGEKVGYRPKSSKSPLSKDSKLTYALVGNQNCGKTTLFNQMTGSNQHVGNFPGVTVDRKDGTIKGYKNTLITDLPGIYSMSPYTSEEIVSRNFVLNEKPTAIINIVDANNVDRNFYLTQQLLEMDIPMVVALNMMDEVTSNGGSVDVNTLEAQLGVPVVPVSATKNQGIDELVNHAIHVARYNEKPLRKDFCSPDARGGAIHRCLHAVRHLIEDKAKAADIPIYFAASKVVEGDRLILDRLQLEDGEKEMLEYIILQMEKESGLDRNAAIADMRYSFIQKICEQAVVKPQESKEHKRSANIDKVLTGKFTAIPVFILIMVLMFWLTFDVIGGSLQGLLEKGIDDLTVITRHALESGGVSPVLTSLITEGIFVGVGSVLSFLPIILVLFLFLSIMEDSGYLARVAFFMDRIMRRIGLSGRSIVPMLIGFGCTVPAVMSSRTLPSERDRKMTVLLTPFMSCTAKLPIYAFFVNAFFSQYKWLVMSGLYLLGVLTGILIALVYKKTIFKGEAVPFVMELPNYRLPGVKNVVQLLWEKAKDFIQKAFTVIFISSLIIWLFQHFDYRFNLVTNSQDSMLAHIAGFIAPVFTPLGMGDWKIVTALISGFIAKESVVSTLGVLYTGNIANVLTSLTAVSILVFSLLYTPCVAAVAAVRRELGRRWALSVAVWQCVIAYIVALIVHCICMLCGM